MIIECETYKYLHTLYVSVFDRTCFLGICRLEIYSDKKLHLASVETIRSFGGLHVKVSLENQGQDEKAANAIVQAGT